MSLLNISATLDRYVIENYPEPLNVKLPDMVFDDSEKDEWIAVEFNPVGAELIGLDGDKGRQEVTAIYTVRCYGEYRKTSIATADTVKSILDGLVIGSIWLDFGVPNPPNELDDGLYETTVNFRVREA